MQVCPVTQTVCTYAGVPTELFAGTLTRSVPYGISLTTGDTTGASPAAPVPVGWEQ